MKLRRKTFTPFGEFLAEKQRKILEMKLSVALFSAKADSAKNLGLNNLATSIEKTATDLIKEIDALDDIIEQFIEKEASKDKGFSSDQWKLIQDRIEAEYKDCKPIPDES